MQKQMSSFYQNKYLYSGKLVCAEHGTCYHHTVYRYKSGNKELWVCKEYGSGNKCTNPIVYTAELNAVMREVYNRIVCEKTTVVNELIDIYKESGSVKSIGKSMHKIQADIGALLAKKDRLLDLSLDGRLSNEEFEQRNNLFNEQIKELRAKITGLEAEEQKNLDLKESMENLRRVISRELDFSDEPDKNVIDSLIEKIVVCKSGNENEINLKIYLKLLPESVSDCADAPQALVFGNGTIAQARGGNSRSRKAYELIYNYELCYCA